MRLASLNTEHTRYYKSADSSRIFLSKPQRFVLPPGGQLLYFPSLLCGYTLLPTALLLR